MNKKILSLFLCLVLVLQITVPAFAEEKSQNTGEEKGNVNNNSIQTYVTEDGKEHTIYWAKGIDAPEMSGTKGADGKYGDFTKTVAPGAGDNKFITYEMPYKTGKKYYDVNKTDPSSDPRCYMAAALNIIYWWMDQNSSNIDRYIEGISSGKFEQNSDLTDIKNAKWNEIRKAPDISTTPREYVYAQYIDDSYITKNYFMAYNNHGTGYYMDRVFDFFINGYAAVRGEGMNSPDAYVPDKNGGLFFPVFGTELLSRSINNATYDYYNQNMKKWIQDGVGVTLAYTLPKGTSHAVTLWGAEYDEKGNIVRVYITDSNDTYSGLMDNETKKLTSVGMFGLDVFEQAGKFHMGNATNRTNNPGVVLGSVGLLDLGTEKWEKALNDNNNEPSAPVIKKQPQDRTYKEKTGAEPVSVAAELAESDKDTTAFLSYQWYKADTKDGSGQAIEYATQSSYVPEIGSAPNKEYYYCEVTNNKFGRKNTVRSNTAEITTIKDEGLQQAPLYIRSVPDRVHYGDKFKLTAEGGSGATSVLSWKVTEGSNIATIDAETGNVEVKGTGYFTIEATNTAKNFKPEKATVRLLAEKAVPEVTDVRAEGKFYENTTKSDMEKGIKFTSSVKGSIALDGEVKLSAGENTLNWTFTPEDSKNYETVKGKITVICFETVKPEKPEVKPDIVKPSELNKVPEGLPFESVEKLSEELEKAIDNILSNKENTKTEAFDIVLNVFENGAYRPATKEELIAKGNITVTIPYPAGTNGEEFDFVVAHMATVAINGLQPGDIETPEVIKTNEGLKFTLRGLSPVMISYSRTDIKPEVKPEVKPVSKPAEPSAPVTGDTNNATLWIALLVIAALAALILLKKKK